MSTDVMHNLQEDKQELQKQLGCMNGLFQLFDRRYLLGQRRHGQHHKKLSQGQSNISKEFKNASEKTKEKNPINIVKEKHRVSVESSRNSFSSSCSSLDCSKRIQTESSSFCPSIVSEPSSPTVNADIRDVVKDSMTRKPRVVPVKTVAKDGRKGPTMTHVDSPRPLVQHRNPCLDDEPTPASRLSRKSVSPRIFNALTRIPLEPAPWKQESKQTINKKARDGCQSVYGQIEKRLTEVEFKTSGKDLRALKQILEAIQRTKMRLESAGPNGSVINPVNVTSDPMVIANIVFSVTLAHSRLQNADLFS